MDKGSKMKLKFDAMPKQTLKAFEYFSNQKWLADSTWYLAGGTGLALQIGFRRSVDLDFFTGEKEIDNAKLLREIGSKDWRTKINKEGTVYGELFSASCSFILYPFFVPKEPLIKYRSISILAAEDIAVMKVIALSQRGKKRDFFDLYYCANNVINLEQIFINLREQYPSVAHNYQHILKSLVYFTDAESDPEPDLLVKLDWKTVKDYFNKEIPALTKKLLNI
jgi:hypothetical protein